MKIGIVGYFGYGNAGDEAMREILLAEFSGSVANFKTQIDKCDAYIIAGGDLVQEFTGLHLPELWKGIKNEPCYALSLGIRKGWEKKADFSLSQLKKFRRIYTREQESFDILSKHIKVSGMMPDLVLMADAPASNKKYPILLNYTTRDWLDANGQFDDLAKNQNIYPVALSPEFDMQFTDRLVNYKEFLSMAKSSQGVIGVRLHAVVMAAIADVPVAAISYEDKVRKFCQRYEIPFFEFGTKNAGKIMHNLKKAKIDLEAERKKIKKVINEIKLDLAGVLK